MRNVRLVLINTISISLLLMSGLLQAKSPPTKANQCFACHGVKGVSLNPEFPSLAGQNKKYLIQQLNAFKNGDRKSQIMKPMASGLSDKDMSEVAGYFASFKAGSGEKIAKGKLRAR